jgi:hypothetical protein
MHIVSRTTDSMVSGILLATEVKKSYQELSVWTSRNHLSSRLAVPTSYPTIH